MKLSKKSSTIYRHVFKGIIPQKSLSPLCVFAFSLGCAVGWGAFMMPGTTFLPVAGPIGTVLGIIAGTAIMLVIGVNYIYMIKHNPDAGGTYSFAKSVLGYDHGFLCAWFLLIVYISVAWANATALPLIIRSLIGDTLQIGFHYTIAGYDVYFGEAMLSLIAIFIFNYMCYASNRLPGITQSLCALALLGGIIILLCAVWGKGGFDPSVCQPAFAPGKSPLSGVVNIIALAPWAFVGFESISHASEEFNFPAKKISWIIVSAVLTAAFCYIALVLIAVSMRPGEYGSWKEYIDNLGNLSGLESVPVINSINMSAGSAGLVILMITLLGAVSTGILGNSFALSRLILSMTRDHMMPEWVGHTDGKRIPANVFPLLMLISIPVPFLGMSVIGWIVDINTIGASIAYLYTSFSVYKTAEKENKISVRITGVLGIIFSVFFFFLFFLIPNFSAVSTLATESYMILVIWSILGFMLFLYIFNKDTERRFGNSTVVWMVLLFLIFFTTTLWIRQQVNNIIETVVYNHSEYHQAELEFYGIKTDLTERQDTDYFMEGQFKIVKGRLLEASIVQMILVMITLIVLFKIYQIIDKRQKEAAFELLKAKNDFLANMSHEIRTPLNSILGMDEIILRESMENNTRDYAFNIKRSGKMLLSLINDILDFSRIEAGKLDLVNEEYDLAMLISDMDAIISSRAAEKGIDFEVKISEDVPHMLYGDSVRMRQVILNLLTNAVKYTESGGAVLTVDCERTDESDIMLRVSVSDTGIGIRKKDLAKLFDAFERFDEGRNRTIEGTGLGMNIVKNLLDLMDSKLKIESVYGKGSTFSFEVRQKIADPAPIGNYNFLSEEFARINEEYHTLFMSTKARILIVEDTELNVLVIKGLLKDTGLDIDIASNGREGLEMTQRNEYDLLLIDHRMPVMDGVEMLQKLRSSKDNPNCNKPCIALTANAGTGARDEYLKVGFDDYLIKPVNGRQLEEMIMAHLPEDKLKKGDILEELESRGLNTGDGIEYSGTRDMYIIALKFFRDSIDKKRSEIEEYYTTENWKDYVTKVHGLKSSARVIGAADLSEHARLIEISGKDGDMDYVHENHKALMEEYDSFKEILSDVES